VIKEDLNAKKEEIKLFTFLEYFESVWVSVWNMNVLYFLRFTEYNLPED
jgi:hypothetical protein